MNLNTKKKKLSTTVKPIQLCKIIFFSNSKTETSNNYYWEMKIEKFHGANFGKPKKKKKIRM